MAKSQSNEFQKKYQENQLTEIRYLGVRAIPVERIIGSVNRWQDYDKHFRSLKSSDFRLDAVMDAVKNGVILPPIEVYKINDDYYVIDGNHRVSAAKAYKQADIDAEVYELLPPANSNSLEHILWREKANFELQTGISIQFTDYSLYRRLLTLIKDYQHQLNELSGMDFSLREASRQWQQKVYEPIIAVIQRSKLTKAFPGHSPDDLFLYILHHQLTKASLQGRKVNIHEAIEVFKKVNPSQLELFIRKIFQGFVFRKKCDQNCGECARSCPEGLICLDDGRIKIDDQCQGCGVCADSCPSQNLAVYDMVAQ